MWPACHSLLTSRTPCVWAKLRAGNSGVDGLFPNILVTSLPHRRRHLFRTLFTLKKSFFYSCIPCATYQEQEIERYPLWLPFLSSFKFYRCLPFLTILPPRGTFCPFLDFSSWRSFLLFYFNPVTDSRSLVGNKSNTVSFTFPGFFLCHIRGLSVVTSRSLSAPETHKLDGPFCSGFAISHHPPLLKFHTLTSFFHCAPPISCVQLVLLRFRYNSCLPASCPGLHSIPLSKLQLNSAQLSVFLIPLVPKQLTLAGEHQTGFSVSVCTSQVYSKYRWAILLFL